MEKTKLSHGVEAMEKEAEKILADARKNADEILSKARIKADKILNSKPDVDDITPQCDKIINDAQVASKKRKDDDAKRIAKIKNTAEKRIDEVVDTILEIVTGAYKG
jgi:cell division septum initiation protein DivIVA